MSDAAGRDELDVSDIGPEELRVSFEDAYARTNCPLCEARFKVRTSQDGKTARCPNCNSRYRIRVDGQDAGGESSRRQFGLSWVLMAFLTALGIGYFAGWRHFEYKVMRALSDEYKEEIRLHSKIFEQDP